MPASKQPAEVYVTGHMALIDFKSLKSAQSILSKEKTPHSLRREMDPHVSGARRARPNQTEQRRPLDRAGNRLPSVLINRQRGFPGQRWLRGVEGAGTIREKEDSLAQIEPLCSTLLLVWSNTSPAVRGGRPGAGGCRAEREENQL